MEIGIYPIQMGFAKSYLLKDQGVILIGDGAAKKAKRFLRSLELTPINLDEIKLIVITHGHSDHAGSASELKELTKANLAMHHLDKDMLEKGKVVMPPGVTPWGRVFHNLIKLTYNPFVSIPKTKVDIVLGDQGMSLAEFGIQGRVLHTPGHTAGSISVVLESGDAFVGCMAMNTLPFCTQPSLPIFADDLQGVKESWKTLLDHGVKTIYPAHGRPFAAKVVQEKFLS